MKISAAVLLTIVSALVVGAKAEIIVNSSVADAIENDDLITLREAIDIANEGKSAPDGDGYYHIVFAPELFAEGEMVTLKIARGGFAIDSGRGVVIQGPGGAHTVVIQDGRSDSGAGESALFTVGDDAVLGLRNLHLYSREYDQAVTKIKSSGKVRIENCRIDGQARSGFSWQAESGSISLERCTLTRLKQTNRALMELTGEAIAQLVQSTISEVDFTGVELMKVADSAKLGVYGCTIDETKSSGGVEHKLFQVGRNSAVEVASCAIDSGSELKWNGEGTVRSDRTSFISLPDYREIRREGVTHRGYPMAEDSNSGAFIGHTADWSSVFLCERKNGGDRHYVRGTNAVSVVIEKTDIVGRGIDEGHVSPGSYATVTKLEKLDPAAIVINSRSDGALTAVADRYSTKYELREVLDYLKAHPEKRSASGETRITFDSAAFTELRSERLRMQQAQIEIDGYTQGKLIIDGGGGAHVMFDGAATAGGQITNRLFYVAPGNRVEFRNLEFVNGIANTSGTGVNTLGGGAIYNCGEIFVSNCSFRACSAGADASGYADGGAILTAKGGKTTVYGTTIEGCTAARGGAIAGRDGGTNLVFASTLGGNRAARGAQVGLVGGGAVYGEGARSVTALVNVSVTDNETDGVGGGVYVVGAGDANTLYLLDTIIVGNRANGVLDDLWLGNRVMARYCVLGRRTPLTDGLFDTEAANVEEGKVAVDVFALIEANGGAPRSTEVIVQGVRHSVYPLANDRNHPSAVALVDDRFEHIGYAEADDQRLLWGALKMVRQLAKPLPIDQVGNRPMSANMGATSISAEPDIPYAENPLLVTSASVAALKVAIENAEVNPMLADAAGVFNVIFADGVETIEFGVDDQPLEITVPMRIVGPITLAKASKGAITLGEGNTLYLDRVKFNECVREEGGGAVLAENAAVFADDGEFVRCRAQSEEGGFGGAICFWGEDSRGRLVRCRFDSCVAVDGRFEGLGEAIYHEDDNLAMLDCVFTTSEDGGGEQVYPKSRVRVEHPTEDAGALSWRYYDTATAAIRECVRGDRLTIISKDCPDLEAVSNSLPYGVSFAIEFEDGSETPAVEAMVSAVAERAEEEIADKNWYKVERSAKAVSVVLNEAVAQPKLDDKSQVEMEVSDKEVYVVPSNVKPNLYYGLGHSTRLDGEYRVDRWLQADDSGRLPDALTAPKSGRESFYRIVVR